MGELLELINSPGEVGYFESYSRSWTALAMLIVGLLFVLISLPGILVDKNWFWVCFGFCGLGAACVSFMALLLNIEYSIKISSNEILVQRGKKITCVNARDVLVFTYDYSEHFYELTCKKDEGVSFLNLPGNLVNDDFIKCLREITPWIRIEQG